MSRYHAASATIQDWYARRLWQAGEKSTGVCWRAEATLPDGKLWRDSGSGPCPDTIRVPSGAADLLVVTDDARPTGPRIVGAAIQASLDETLYHGSKAEFSTFRPSVSSVRGWGIFLSDSRMYAEAFGGFIYTCRVRLNNPKVYATSSDFVVDEMKSGGTAEDLTRGLAEDGFDGVVIERSKVSTGTVREVIAFDQANMTQLGLGDDDVRTGYHHALRILLASGERRWWYSPDGKAFEVEEPTHELWIGDNKEMLKKDYGVELRTTGGNMPRELVGLGWGRILGVGSRGMNVEIPERSIAHVESFLIKEFPQLWREGSGVLLIINNVDMPARIVQEHQTLAEAYRAGKRHELSLIACRRTAARVQTFCTPERSQVQGLWDSMMSGDAPESGGPWSVADLLSDTEIDEHLAERSAGGFVGWRLLPETREANAFPTEYPPAGDTVSGLRVTDNIPNIDSISASMMEYEILDGVREVPMAHFPGRRSRLDSKVGVEGSSELAREIEGNGWIDPLIVGIEADAVEKGPYILEGAHRFDALAELGIESFPALVVLDTYGSMPTVDPGGSP